MTFSMMLLKAKSVGIRSFRDHCSQNVNNNKPIVITDRGERKGVYLPYNDVIEMADILDELQDRELIKTIAEGRKSIALGKGGALFSESIKRHRKYLSHK